MVNSDEEPWESERRKKRRDELRSRIESTPSGLDWIMRVDYIGKDNPLPSISSEEEPGE